MVNRDMELILCCIEAYLISDDDPGPNYDFMQTFFGEDKEVSA